MKMTKEALRRLCNAGGWTYAALWLIDCRDPRLLVLEETYHEVQSVNVFAKMINHVHVVEQGTIGEVALSGKHRWINFEKSSDVNPDLFQNNAEWQLQILAGIKTVAVIPVPSFGVIQFGSTQKICQSSEFITQAQSLLLQLQFKQHVYVHTDLNFCHPQETFASAVPSMDSSRFKNNISSHDSFCKQRQANSLSLECSMPVTTSCAYNDHGYMFYNTPYFTGTSSSSRGNLCATSSKNHIGAKKINSLPYIDHQPFPGMNLPEVFNTIQTTSHSSIPDVNACHSISGGLVLLHGKCGSKTMLDNGSVSSSKFSPVTPDFPENFLTSTPDRNNSTSVNGSTNNRILDKSMNNLIHSMDMSRDWIEGTSDFHKHLVSNHNELVSDHNDMFNDMELDPSPMMLRQECWDDLELPVVSTSCTNLSTGVSDCLSQFTIGSITDSGKEFFTDSGSFEQLLDAVVSCNSVVSQDSRHHISNISELSNAQTTRVPLAGPSSFVRAPAEPLPEFNIEKMMQGSSKEAQTSWIDDTCSVNGDGSALHLPNKQEESTKVVRKRARPGESTRPKPKDRQQIQDRVKELREIVPNGTKCSIDALLDRTIKHMLFLQSVTKYADKVKQVDEPELIGEESGVVLKDNTNGSVGGATWAYEVAGQTMVCPILVEDIHPSGQMVVEMLCEERGFFLEIADVVRGFGLTILKGVMEIREKKLWSKFLVEANRDVTRMDIFLSLVQLLHQASSFGSAVSNSRSIFEGGSSLPSYQQQYRAPIPIGFDDRLL